MVNTCTRLLQERTVQDQSPLTTLGSPRESSRRPRQPSVVPEVQAGATGVWKVQGLLEEHACVRDMGRNVKRPRSRAAGLCFLPFDKGNI